MKSYENGTIDWHSSSRQYQVMQTLSFDERGFYTDGKYIAVAMSAYYGNVGDKFRITLENEKLMYVIKADEKASSELINSCTHEDGSMIEFIVDVPTSLSYYGTISNGLILDGNFNNHEDFEGEIIKVERLEGERK